MTYISCCSLRKGPLVKIIFILSYISGKCKEKWATFRNTLKSRRLFFAFSPFIIHRFVESEKRLSWTQNAKTPHIYPILLEQMARVFARRVRGIFFKERRTQNHDCDGLDHAGLLCGGTWRRQCCAGHVLAEKERHLI